MALDDLDDLIKLRRKNKPKVSSKLGTLKDADIWAEVERRRRGFEATKAIKVAELETLLADRYRLETNVPTALYVPR